MIHFKKLRWKNLLGTGNQFIELPLDKSQTTLIIGKNGHGKSTFLDALCYVLFKKPFRKVNKDTLVNTINKSDCVIEVEFEIGTHQYKISRGINKDFFKIDIDGDIRLQAAGQKDDQRFLEEDILRVNYDSFTQVVILGNAKYIPFMQLKSQQRREFLEYILDIGVFSSMGDVLKSKMTNLKTKLESISREIEGTNDKVKLVQGFILKLEKDSLQEDTEILQKIQQSNQQIQDCLEEINQSNIVISRFGEKIEDQQTISENIQELLDRQKKGKSKLSEETIKLSFYVNNDNCKTCGQEIQESHKCNIMTEKEAQITKYEKALKVIDSRLKEKYVRQKEINEVNVEIQKINKSILEKNGTIKALRTYANKLELDRKKAPVNIQEQYTKRDQLIATITRLELEKNEVIETKHYYDVATVLLKDSGIKSTIIKQYLPTINKLVNKYLSDLDFFLAFSLDEGFNETFKMRYRDTLSYYNFSQGETMRIDLALLFAWIDIARMKNSCCTNLLILDEVIDSSLDEQGRDLFIKLLNQLSQSNVFVISQNDTAIDRFKDIIRFKTIGGFSHMEIAA